MTIQSPSHRTSSNSSIAYGYGGTGTATVRTGNYGGIGATAGAGLMMFAWGPAAWIYLAAGVTDMRKGFEGLYGLVRDSLQCEALSGHIFVFSNRQRNRLKLLFWDNTGLWVCSKRLEKGLVGWPAPVSGQAKVVLSHDELALLLGGIDLEGTKRRRWYQAHTAARQ